MARILIIEDEQDLQQILAYNLGRAGYEVIIAGTGKEGLVLAKTRAPDLLLLDLMLPDISGLDVCRGIRQDPALQSLAVIMLTARGEEIDRVLGFELGADDYVVKPFSVRELILRVAAVLKRRQSVNQIGPISVFGPLRIDREAHRVWVGEAELELTALEFKLLVVLHDRRDRVQTRATLLDDVWGIEADITTRTVDTHVKRLREKLGPAGSFIETVRKVGYRFADRPDQDDA